MITQVRSYYVLGHNSKSNHRILEIPTGNEGGSQFSFNACIKKISIAYLGPLKKERRINTM